MEWDLAERLDRARRWRGWSQTELAKRAGMNFTQVHRLLHNHNPRARVETLRQLAVALAVSGDYLMGLSDEMEPKQLPLLNEEELEEKDFVGAVAQLVGA
ncbi:hypothetical protein C2W62_36420 [Candidatus Entotheonella serta]|nr:hypothetical protein C2W62_36420 [Candidatus Entotheonella serta]